MKWLLMTPSVVCFSRKSPSGKWGFRRRLTRRWRILFPRLLVISKGSDQLALDSTTYHVLNLRIDRSAYNTLPRRQVVSELIDEWLAVQRNWLYLQPIFDSEDINKQLPAEGKRFSSVDKHWRATMMSAGGGAL